MFALVDGPFSNLKPFLHMMFHFQLENVKDYNFFYNLYT